MAPEDFFSGPADSRRSQLKRIDLFLLILILVLPAMLSACSGGGGGGSGGTPSISGTVAVQSGLYAAGSTGRSYFADLDSKIDNFTLISSAFAASGSGGTPLDGAEISLIDQNGSVVSTAASNDSGAFDFFALPPGRYSIYIAHQSIYPVQISDVSVINGDTTIVDSLVTAAGNEASVQFQNTLCSGEESSDPAIAATAAALAEASGVSSDEVLDIRLGGCLGWAQTAAELGLSVSALNMDPPSSSGGGITGVPPGGITGTTPGSISGSTPGGIDGTAPGSISGAAPGATEGTTPGSISGSTPGAIGGSAPGSINGSTPGSISGSTPGSISGSAPGSITGSTPGSSSGTTPGSISGSTPGSINGSTPGSISGSTPGSISGSTPGSISGSTPGSSSGTTPGSISGSTPGSINGSTPGSISGSTPGSISGSTPGSSTGAAPGSITGTLPPFITGTHP